MDIPETAPILDPKQLDSAIMLDPKSIELSREYNRRYLHWDELRYRECGAFGRQNLWYLMKINRESTSKHLTFNDLEVSYNHLDSFHRDLHDIDMCLSSGFIPTKKMAEKRRMMYAISSIMEESIASSQIEGASTTTRVAKDMLRNNRPPRNRSEQMILNNYDAMGFIRSSLDRPLSSDLIKELHTIISHRTLDDDSFEGMFRTDDSIAVSDPSTGKIYHQPVPFERIEPMVSELCSFINNDEPFIHPIIKGVVRHFVLAYIHPFVDGNGRVARSLFYWFTMRNGYGFMEYLSISKAISRHRGKYDLAYLLSETDGNDITYFIRYNLGIIMESIDIFSRYLEEKMEQQDRTLGNLRSYGLSTRQEDVLAEMIQSGEPTTAYELATMFNTQVQNIRKDLLVLMDKGLVDIYGKDGRKITYIYRQKD